MDGSYISMTEFDLQLLLQNVYLVHRVVCVSVYVCGRDQSCAAVQLFSVTDTELEFYVINIWRRPRHGYGNIPVVAT